MSSSIAYSQTISNDSLKCFTYDQARKIITDLRKLPIKDSIISNQDSIISNMEKIDSVRVDRINDYAIEVTDLINNNKRLLKQRKKVFIIGFLLGVIPFIFSLL